MSIHPQIIERAGKKEFAVIPYDEFLLIQEALEDYDDLRLLREEKANSGNEVARPLEVILAEMASS